VDTSVERVVGPGAILGEGPTWDEREGILWWLDIPGSRLHRFDPATGTDSAVDLPRPAGTLVPRASGGLVLATPRGFEAYDPTTGDLQLLASVEADDPKTRMNDGKCDRQGRLWAGTMAFEATPGAGAFYRLGTDLAVERQVDDVTISNGLAWSADDSVLYWVDSMTHGVDAFDFDPATGTISDRRTVIKIPEDEGVPDGMTIDTEGYLWVALFGGKAVRRYSTDGRLDGVIELPVDNVTCAAFGGPDLGDLYITTAKENLSPEQLAAQPDAGSLYRCRPGVTGYATNAFGG
jgi:sugar lactone lactonase YvrE